MQLLPSGCFMILQHSYMEITELCHLNVTWHKP